MTDLDLLPITIAARIATRRHKRNYTGRHHTRRNAPATWRLSPAAYQLVTRTTEHVPATPDQDTGLLDLTAIRAAVNSINTREEL
ncbi:hypothetical protein ABZ793_12050 [Micromonospora sp. NPDC047465]|uniref:hypothetical protein n=1 Tax=Micromonospora sp. NPDC047465 TaxID=3154813 RepID=UPI0033E96E45